MSCLEFSEHSVSFASGSGSIAALKANMKTIVRINCITVVFTALYFIIDYYYYYGYYYYIAFKICTKGLQC